MRGSQEPTFFARKERDFHRERRRGEAFRKKNVRAERRFIEGAAFKMAITIRGGKESLRRIVSTNIRQEADQ
ncbi:hypothetical protein HMPREF1986_02600 [Oribacterium sp. oral taxon 078 str. F0263]|nr:hypothetical protein HMPREF1986_02600 [Oribacterium sp. oral taxon 078 str. F0263]